MTAVQLAVRSAVPPKSAVVDASIQTADGRVRAYHLYVPSGAITATLPLLVALHGAPGNEKQFEWTSRFDGIAEANNFLVVYTDGVGTGPNGAVNRIWKGGSCCGVASRTDVDDVAFIAQLVVSLQQAYHIDPHRLVAAGHSNGGILAYRLACQISNVFAGIGFQWTSLEFAPCTPAQPVSLLHIHGTADQNIPIGGRVGQIGVSGVAFNPLLDGVHTIATADGCGTSPVDTTDAANADLSLSLWHSCSDGTAVEFIKVAGAPHAWMGHPPVPGAGSSTPYQGLDSSVAI